MKFTDRRGLWGAFLAGWRSEDDLIKKAEEKAMNIELVRLRRIETVARAALVNGNVKNSGTDDGLGSDDADALAAALGDAGE